MRKYYRKIIDKLTSLLKGAILVNSKFGKKVFISKNAYVSNSDLNDYTSVGRNTTIANAQIGKFCSISWNVTIGATQHPIDRISTHAFVYVTNFGFVSENNKFKNKTEVGNDVWIGANAIIMPGLKIGDGSIIGAGAVVTKSVPDFSIVVGSPAKVISQRFSETQIKRLQKIRWWDLEPHLIKDNLSLWRNTLDDETLKRLEQLCK